MSSSIPEFRDRMPWWGGDLQTLRNQIVSPPASLGGSESDVAFMTSDETGDVLTGKLNAPPVQPVGPTILLLHGLTGCEDSTYMRETAKFHVSLGRTVVRANLRGAGPSRPMAGGYYYMGGTSDIHDMLDGLEPDLTARGIFIIGYSLGGNLLLNFLAGSRGEHPLVGAATVSAPIRPLEACERLMSKRNSVYHHFLLRRMKEQSLAPNARLSAHERLAIRSAKSLFEFDDKFTAPRHGYDGAEDYYAKTAGYQFVSELPVPTILIHARNDPWIPAQPYDELEQRQLDNADIVVVPSGGHVGFHDRASPTPWHDRTINHYLEAIIQRSTKGSESVAAG